MPACRFILCEKTSRWAAALRARLGRSIPQLLVTCALPGCAEALAASPASFIAIEVTASNLESTLDFTCRISSHYPNAAVVALLSSEFLAAAPLFREAGAIDVVASALESPRIARLAQRHFAQAPTEQLTTRQFIAQRLPWPAHATNSAPPRSAAD